MLQSLSAPRRRFEPRQSLDVDIEGIDIVDVSHSEAAAEKAVELVRAGNAGLLMKGSLHSDELLGAVTKRETGFAPPDASVTCSSWTSPPIRRRCSSPTPR